MYQDMDFDGQFITLTSTEEVKYKAPLKIIMTEPVVLTLSHVDLSDIESVVPQSSDASSCHSSGSQDTILLSPQDESGTS